MMLPVLSAGLGRLEAIELWQCDVELCSPLRAAHGMHATLPKLFVRVLTEAGEGWGEVAAVAHPVGQDPTTAEVAAQLLGRWFPRMLESSAAREGHCPESHAVGMLGGATVLDQVAGAALEMAILDAELRIGGVSLVSWLGVTRASVIYGGLVGIAPEHSIAWAVATAESLVDAGASRLRVKIDPAFCVEPLGVIRTALPGVAIHADANGSFGPSSLEALHAVDALGLVCIEQPLDTRDLAQLAQLAEKLSTPVCLDETLTTRRVARDALRYGACRALCVKPARVGGLRSARAILVEASSVGASCFLGGMFETGLGRAFLGALAALPEADLVSDVAAPSTYLEEDPCGLEGPSEGLQPLHLAPGVGPWPGRDRLIKVAGTPL